ncbi:MAG TPA: NAD(P)/FAD-dependent oxidoreductase [Trebonia sp.]|jgi:cyclohexanone monooxygenase
MTDLDVVVVGAGFAGIYAVHALRTAGLSVRALEAGSGIGGTWFWNRYPGARCDVEAVDYSYSFDPALEQDWTWSERYPAQPEVLRYLNHVADRFGLWPDIQLDTRVTACVWDGQRCEWTVLTDDGESRTARFCVMATGCLSAQHVPAVPGLDDFRGEWFHTSRWPGSGVDFSGKRVGLIGTGSTGIQVAPEIAAAADQLYVFQRTANFAVPNRNRRVTADETAAIKAAYAGHRERARASMLGVPVTGTGRSALDESPRDRHKTYAERWEAGGGMPLLGSYTDLLVSREANDTVAEFIRDRIRETVTDPAIADLLCPRTYPVGSKRLCQSDDYYALFNQPNVTLVDVATAPITKAYSGGISTAARDYDLDALVFATGFDAVTGALARISVVGTGGRTLRQAWSDGPAAYLGVAVAGFPNLFCVTGPGSPSVLSNMVLSIEQHVEFIAGLIGHALSAGGTSVSVGASEQAQAGWAAHVHDVAYSTLFPCADSWYSGANIPGKPRVFTPYVGGVGPYRERLDAVAGAGYEGFTLVVSGR